MNRGRFDPFADYTAVRDRIHRLMNEVGQPVDEAGRANARVWQPPVDILEDENEVRVQVDLPGLKRESIDVQMTGENLTVRGERRHERAEGAHVVYCERPEGVFQRSFTVGVPVQGDKVGASYRDGVLTITLPKAEAVKPRKVEIQAGE